MNLRSSLFLFSRLSIASVLFIGGFLKATGPAAEFAGALAAYQILPAVWVIPLSHIIPWMELLTGTYLFFGFYTRFFATVAAALYFSFIVFLASTIFRHIDLASCGCFGAIEMAPKKTISLDAACFLLSLLTVHAGPVKPSIDFWL
jgi:uncharacterized membrane protein YphA (DoxX/SURF4 family)